MRSQERRYPALTGTTVLLKAFAIFIAVVGVIAAITTPFTLQAGFVTEFAAVIGVLLSALIPALLLYAIADLILVVIDIEHNTYQTREMMQPRVEELKRPEERRPA